jgi:sterol desaturase/sphingolipid hydroxylase (fatty acid hydroxylase superfamily)
MKIIEASIPFFFLLIALEIVVSRWRRQRLMRLNDSINDLSLGILSQLSDVFTKVASVGIFALVERHLAVQRWTTLPAWNDAAPFVRSSGWTGFSVSWAALASWTAVFLLVDLAYYFMHRYSHVINILWAGHVVHHSSEEYNLTVALRQSSLHGLLSWIFYIPLALAGVPVAMFAACYALNLVYQFWIHTRAVDKLWAPLEWVLNTPSHHRVHHGVNARYLDKNYAGVLIIWDRMLGTFEPEDEEVVYGITKPLATWNPLWANVHVFASIGRAAARATTWRQRLQVVFGPPGAEEAVLRDEAHPAPLSVGVEKFDPEVPPAVTAYATVQFVVVLVASIFILDLSRSLALHENIALVFYVAVALTNIGGLFEVQPWVVALEAARLLTLAVAATVLAATGVAPMLPSLAVVAFAVGSMGWLVWLRPRLQPVESVAAAVTA